MFLWRAPPVLGFHRDSKLSRRGMGKESHSTRKYQPYEENVQIDPNFVSLASTVFD